MLNTLFTRFQNNLEASINLSLQLNELLIYRTLKMLKNNKPSERIYSYQNRQAMKLTLLQLQSNQCRGQRCIYATYLQVLSLICTNLRYPAPYDLHISAPSHHQSHITFYLHYLPRQARVKTQVAQYRSPREGYFICLSVSLFV